MNVCESVTLNRQMMIAIVSNCVCVCVCVCVRERENENEWE